MNINKTAEEHKLIMSVEGRRDTNSSPVLLQEFTEASQGMDDVVVDIEKVSCISSAGLRALLSMQKVMNQQGKMTIVNVTRDMMDVFDMTGFSDILNIE